MNKRRIIQKQQQRKKQDGKTGGGSRMSWIIGGVVVAAVLIVGLLIVLSRPGGAPQASSKDWPQPEGTALGPEDAPAQIRVYSDFQCPYCKLFSNTTQQQIIDTYVATGKARLEYHHLIVIDRNVGGNESRRAAEASECAAEQGRFWDYAELLFANQQAEGAGNFADDRLRGYAEELGLDTTRFNTCLSSSRYANKVKLDEAQAMSLRVAGTPAVFVNGTLVQNPLDWNIVRTQIEAALGPDAE